MFGYIRPASGELLVKDSELYRAVYCGLCRYSGKHISHFSRFMLNYDFVLLALLRISLTQEAFTVEKRRCPYKFKKRATVKADGAYALTASAFGLFSYYKLQDDIRDNKGFKKLVKKLLMPYFSHLRKRSLYCQGLEDEIKSQFEKLVSLEESLNSSPDIAADTFAKIISAVASFGLDGNNARIASECGYHIGRFVYLADAFDDLKEDEKSGGYNAFALYYQTAENAVLHKDEIAQTLVDSMNAFSNAYALCCGEEFTSADRIIFNICELGGRLAARKINAKYDLKKDK